MFTWEKNFGLLLKRVPKLPRKSLLFFLLLVCGDIESCPELQVQENLADISKLRGIKFVPQNIRGFLGKKDISETLFTNEKFIITLSQTHIASLNFELFQIPGFEFIHKNWIPGESGGVAVHLSENLK